MKWTDPTGKMPMPETSDRASAAAAEPAFVARRAVLAGARPTPGVAAGRLGGPPGGACEASMPDSGIPGCGGPH